MLLMKSIMGAKGISEAFREPSVAGIVNELPGNNILD
jgi:hypothetical protein